MIFLVVMNIIINNINSESRTMKIYRAEYDNGAKIGQGLYQHKNPLRNKLWSMLEAHNHSNYPTFEDDDFGNVKFSEYFYFACPTIESFIYWFDGYINLLYETGHSIAEYEVSNCIISNSNKQCVFEKHQVIGKTYLTKQEILTKV